ncbi:MAG TPA: hypothetical protein DDX20_01875 [Stenotrophomonas sp.]|nr:hypothetical protein [Stenotrophomonas sp.]
MEFLLLVNKNGTAGVQHYADYPHGARWIASGARRQGVYADRNAKAREWTMIASVTLLRGRRRGYIGGQREK